VASFIITAIVLAVLVFKFIVLRPARFFKNRNNRMDTLIVPLAFCFEVAFFKWPSPYRDIGSMIMSVRLLRLGDLTFRIKRFDYMFFFFFLKKYFCFCFFKHHATHIHFMTMKIYTVLSINIFKKLYVLLVGKEYLIFTLQSVFLFIMLWATCGMMVFAGYDADDDVSYSASNGDGFTDPNLGFDTFAIALFTMFQVFTTSNWHEVMYRGMASMGVPTWASPVFFISFHYFITTVVMQLMIAILVEMFIQISSGQFLFFLLNFHFLIMLASLCDVRFDILIAAHAVI
jgi:hypothetical protein